MDNEFVSFDMEATITINDIQFHANISETSSEFSSENLQNSIVFENDSLKFEDIVIKCIPENNSAFHINGLVSDIIKNKSTTGTYNNIPFICDFDKNTKLPKKIIWGNISIDFE